MVAREGLPHAILSHAAPTHTALMAKCSADAEQCSLVADPECACPPFRWPRRRKRSHLRPDPRESACVKPEPSASSRAPRRSPTASARERATRRVRSQRRTARHAGPLRLGRCRGLDSPRRKRRTVMAWEPVEPRPEVGGPTGGAQRSTSRRHGTIGNASGPTGEPVGSRGLDALARTLRPRPRGAASVSAAARARVTE
jgi:hypothetical protein